MSEWAICCDFDGTISLPDSCDYLLKRYASAEWEELDRKVWAGEITEREAFPRQMALLCCTWDEARQALSEGVRIRDGFAHFVGWCRERDLPLAVLSGGLQVLIEDILHRAGIDGVTVLAHGVDLSDGWSVQMRSGRRLAEHCGHCKCGYLADLHDAGKKVIYIGDSYTDVCPAQRADMLFATYKLADVCRREGRAFYPYDTFYDVERQLDQLLKPEQEQTP